MKKELAEAKTTFDELQKKTADYDTLKEQAEKADTLGEELSGLKLSVAFDSVKPKFADSVNEYEAKAKWDEFKKLCGFDDNKLPNIKWTEELAIKTYQDIIKKHGDKATGIRWCRDNGHKKLVGYITRNYKWNDFNKLYKGINKK